LYLGNNQLTSLPPEIGHLSSLQILNLEHNQLTSLPSEVGRLPLHHLLLTDNALIDMGSIDGIDAIDIDIVGSEIQRLPTALPVPSVEDDDNLHSNSNADPDLDCRLFFLQFNEEEEEEEEGNHKEDSPLLLPVHHPSRMAARWPYFRCLISPGFAESQSNQSDLSAFFSLRLGRCLIDYLQGEVGSLVDVSSLTLQDCDDFIRHADFFQLTDTLLFKFCVAYAANKGKTR
jgi:Leucine-rich repeat (LRR) protein